VGRRGTARFLSNRVGMLSNGAKMIAGECTGYCNRAGMVGRRVTLSDDGRLVLSDYWETLGDQRPVVTFILPDGWRLTQQTNSSLIAVSRSTGKLVEINFHDGAVEDIEPTNYFPKGPMKPAVGNKIIVRPVGKKLETVIHFH